MKHWTQQFQRSIVSVIVFSFLIQLLGGCDSAFLIQRSNGKKYSYLYQMIEPLNLTKLDYKDSQISISFTIDDAAISYTILNLTAKNIVIESGAATMGIDSVYTPVRNSMSLYSDSVRGFSPLNLPARGFLSDMVIPRNNIYWGGDGWIEKDLFTTIDSGTVAGRRKIAKNIGKKLEFYLPMKIDGKSIDYIFKFKVVASKIVTPDKSVSDKQRPPAPRLYNGNFTPWITVAIISGVALVSSIFIFSSKKPVGPLN